MKKKTLAILLSAAMLVTGILSGCGGGGSTSSAASSGSTDSTSSAASPPQLTANQPTIRKKPPETVHSGGFHIIDRVQVDPVLLQFEMQMRPGRKAGAANISNELPLRHALSRGNNVIGHVHIDGREAV